MAQVRVAESAGFCFGVSRAVRIVEELADSGKRACTLGSIIHNEQETGRLARKGIRVVESVEEMEPGETLVIRSHGVPAQVIGDLEKKGVPYVDATCPFVKKIHQIVAKGRPGQDVVLIAGDASHPEVQGTLGNCNCECYTFTGPEELREILEKWTKGQEKFVILTAQTTFNTNIWRECVKTAEKVYTNLEIFDTICNATVDRQEEAGQIARQVDRMVVVGGRHSSNTAKLQDICAPYCPTILVETAKELRAADFSGCQCVGVTAGASTPAYIIKEVQTTMAEILNNFDDENFNFEEALEQSFKSVHTGEKVKGIVEGIQPNEITVDIGTKHAGFIPIDELTDDPTAKPEDIVHKGDEIDLIVLRVNDQEGTVKLSKKKVDAIAGLEKVMDAAETGEILEGVVTDVIKGGVLAVSGGVKVFIPASQATASRNDPIEDLLKQPVRFKILEVNRARKRAVGSIRAVLREEKKVLADKFWEQVEVGQRYTATVKSIEKYGAFVDLGGVDGMIHISELSWQRIKHPSEVVKVGDTVDVYIKELNPETRKISLGYKQTKDNPWEILRNEYPAGSIVNAKIVSMTTFGAFAQIIPGVDGLIHISQISTERVGKPEDVLAIGQEVQVKIIDIDFEKKRVSLSMRALMEDGQEAEDSGEDTLVMTTEGFVPDENAPEEE